MKTMLSAFIFAPEADLCIVQIISLIRIVSQHRLCILNLTYISPILEELVVRQFTNTEIKIELIIYVRY